MMRQTVLYMALERGYDSIISILKQADVKPLSGRGHGKVNRQSSTRNTL